jgi:hypothetical protein
MIPRCPQCERELAALVVMVRRNRWGGTGPRPRPELWWECPGCGWLGYQHRQGGHLVPMRRLEGTEADCVFCGEEQASVASDAWQQDDGEQRDWVVCLACGTSNPRRVIP